MSEVLLYAIDEHFRGDEGGARLQGYLAEKEAHPPGPSLQYSYVKIIQ